MKYIPAIFFIFLFSCTNNNVHLQEIKIDSLNKVIFKLTGDINNYRSYAQSKETELKNYKAEHPNYGGKFIFTVIHFRRIGFQSYQDMIDVSPVKHLENFVPEDRYIIMEGFEHDERERNHITANDHLTNIESFVFNSYEEAYNESLRMRMERF